MSYTLLDKIFVFVSKEALANGLQQITVKGKVRDEKGEPLPGVNIVEMGTTNGVISDINGLYSIAISSPEAFLYIHFRVCSSEAALVTRLKLM
jgi:hypothetical protein